MAHYDVIVIGLGCAGATAASVLARAGKRVLALEAQPRVGGRVRTVPFGGGLVEEGAEWLHGTQGSRLYEAAQEHKISLIDQEVKFHVYRSDGGIADEEMMNELILCCFDGIDNPPKDFLGGMGDFITKRLMDYIKENYPHLLDDKVFLDEFIRFLSRMVCNYESSNDWNDITVKSSFVKIDGHYHVSWHKYGYKTFFDLLLNTYNNGPGLPSLDIKLSCPVSRIDWAGGTTRVVCDTHTYTTDAVVVTVSLGVLKARYKSLFNPGLPDEKIEAIENMSMGSMGKIIFNFPHAWWPKQGWFYAFIWQTEDINNVSEDDLWITNIFSASNPMGCETALTFWTSGDTTILVESLPEEMVQNKCMELLNRFMGKSCFIPEPIAMIRSTWATNPYTLGSYTYENRHTDASVRDRLAAPLCPNGTLRVLFAGEATHTTQYSMAHGAADSGYTAAKVILNSTNK